MDHNRKHERWLYLAVAASTWMLATGLVIEKVVSDGISSWALLLATPVLTGAVGLLLHIAFTSSWKWLYAIPLAGLCLAVTLPASIGASGSARDNAVAKAEASNRTADQVADDLRFVKSKLKWAVEDMAAECASGEGTACRGKRSTVNALQDRQDKLTGGLQAAPAKVATLAGETRVATVLGWFGASLTSEDVKTIWPVLPPIALELLCAAFLTMGLAVPRVKQAMNYSSQTSFPVTEPLPSPEIFSEPPKGTRVNRVRKPKIEHAIASVREYTLKHGTPPTFSVIRGKHKLSKASASRARAEGIRQAAAA